MRKNAAGNLACGEAQGQRRRPAKNSLPARRHTFQDAGIELFVHPGHGREDRRARADVEIEIVDTCCANRYPKRRQHRWELAVGDGDSRTVAFGEHHRAGPHPVGIQPLGLGLLK